MTTPYSVILRPTERAVRPSSASAKLQSHPSFYSPLVDNKKRVSSAYQNLAGRSRRAILGADVRIEEEDYKSEAQLRRSTVSGAEQLGGKDHMIQSIDVAAGEESFKTKVEEYVTIDILRKLLMAFIKNRQSRYEEGRLSKEEFRDIMKEHLSGSGIKPHHIIGFFEKIDWPNEGSIGWSDFCTYMQLQYSQREELYVKEKAVHLALPAKSRIAPHRDDVIKCLDIGDNLIVSCGKDGYVCFWSSTNLEIRRHKDLIASSSAPFKKTRSRMKWSTDACVMTEFSKLCIATGDREFLFYELSSLAPYCQLAKVPGIPISICYSTRSSKGKSQPGRKNEVDNQDEGVFVFGDTNGHVHVLSLLNPGEFLRNWKKAKPLEPGGLPTTPFEEVLTSPNCRYVCWAVHNDWAHTVFHWQELDQIVSASNDSYNSIVIGCVFPLTDVDSLRDGGKKGVANSSITLALHPARRPADQQTVFRIHKGVKAITISHRFNCLITGGMDRVIRTWSPFSPNMPTGVLRGHAAPIVSISADDADARIFSFSQDKAVRVWSLTDQTCLLSIKTKSHKIVGDLQVAIYSPLSKVIAMATDRMSIIPVFTRAAVHLEVVSTHREPVNCCLYNPVFNHVVSCSEGSVIRVWDLDTGGLVFEFGEAHGESGITCACFDVTWRRLITGGRDGVSHIFNYNNGHKLKTLMPSRYIYRPKPNAKPSVSSIASTAHPPIGSNAVAEICDVSYVELNKNRYVIVTGWDRRINIFMDNPGVDVDDIQAPSFRWDDDVVLGHQDDILCTAQSPPNWLATADFSGRVVVWNMVSGHQLANLEAPDSSMTKSANPAIISRDHSADSGSILNNAYDRKSSGRRSRSSSPHQRFLSPNASVNEMVHLDTAVRKIIFLPLRAAQRSSEGAQLVAAGPHGCLHFYGKFAHGGKLMARVAGSALNDGVATAMAVDTREECLFSADSFGYVYKWNIENYAVSGDFETETPELRCFFRCHVDAITSLVFVDKYQVLLTSSVDCTVRIWDLTGGYIGTFGQSDLWDIRNPSTYRRPHVPYDVLIDPLSVPGPSGVIDGTVTDPNDRVTLVEVLAEMKAEQKANEAEVQDEWFTRHSFKMPSDQQIEEDLKKRTYSAGNGKRLRHERQKVAGRAWLGPSHYQTLRCHDLDDGPTDTAQQAEATRKELARQAPQSSFDDLLP